MSDKENKSILPYNAIQMIAIYQNIGKTNWKQAFGMHGPKLFGTCFNFVYTGGPSIRAADPIPGDRKLYRVSFNDPTSPYTGLVEVQVKCNITDDLGYHIPPVQPLVLTAFSDPPTRCGKPAQHRIPSDFLINVLDRLWCSKIYQKHPLHDHSCMIWDGLLLNLNIIDTTQHPEFLINLCTYLFRASWKTSAQPPIEKPLSQEEPDWPQVGRRLLKVLH